MSNGTIFPEFLFLADYVNTDEAEFLKRSSRKDQLGPCNNSKIFGFYKVKGKIAKLLMKKADQFFRYLVYVSNQSLFRISQNSCSLFEKDIIICNPLSYIEINIKHTLVVQSFLSDNIPAFSFCFYHSTFFRLFSL